MSLSEQLRAVLRSEGKSIRRLARTVGVDRAGLSKFLSGQRQLSPATLDKIVSTLGLLIVKPPAAE
jgi:transcriptional regulator with XRE-family HTH domain